MRFAVGDHVEAYLRVVDDWVRGVVTKARPTPGKEWGEGLYSIRYGKDGSTIELHPERDMRPLSVVDRLAELAPVCSKCGQPVFSGTCYCRAK